MAISIEALPQLFRETGSFSGNLYLRDAGVLKTFDISDILTADERLQFGSGGAQAAEALKRLGLSLEDIPQVLIPDIEMKAGVTGRQFSGGGFGFGVGNFTAADLQRLGIAQQIAGSGQGQDVMAIGQEALQNIQAAQEGQQNLIQTGTMDQGPPPFGSAENTALAAQFAQTGLPQATEQPLAIGELYTGQDDVFGIGQLPNLQEGATGDEVARLQQFLLAGGYDIPALQSGTAEFGYFGPQTRAALAAFQTAQGIGDPSERGFFGPKTRAFVSGTAPTGTTTTTTTDSTSSFTNIATKNNIDLANFQASFETNPVGTIKALMEQIMVGAGAVEGRNQIQTLIEEREKLQNELDERIADINDNPWISEALRSKQVIKAQEEFAGKIDNRTQAIAAFESALDDARAEAQFAASMALDIFQRERNYQLDLARLQNQAETNISTFVEEVNGRKVLYNKTTGEVIADLGPSSGTTTTGTFTQTQINKGAAAAKMSIEEFENLPLDEANNFINGNWIGLTDQEAQNAFSFIFNGDPDAEDPSPATDDEIAEIIALGGVPTEDGDFYKFTESQLAELVRLLEERPEKSSLLQNVIDWFTALFGR